MQFLWNMSYWIPSFNSTGLNLSQEITGDLSVVSNSDKLIAKFHQVKDKWLCKHCHQTLSFTVQLA